MTLDPSNKKSKIIGLHLTKNVKKNQTKLSDKNYEKLRKLVGSGFTKIYKNDQQVSNS